jgi:MAX-like protein X
VAGLFKSSAASKADKLIDNNLTKLFQCMSIVYRQKLTSPKWNRFLGLKLRWKDKIRLNNVIWRCWHMQFVKRQRKLVFAFGNPIEIDNHSKTESGAIMMGKYWKRKMDSVLAEYKKWRIFYKNQNNGAECIKYTKADKALIRTGQDDIDLESMITDADFFVDAIFNSLESQPMEFEDDWSKTYLNNSDLIQPGLIQLQPNLDDMLDLDPRVTMADWFSAKHPDPMRRKSLTPEQDIYNQKYTMNIQEPSRMVPPTNLEIQHNRNIKTNTVQSSLPTQNISSIGHKQGKGNITHSDTRHSK